MPGPIPSPPVVADVGRNWICLSWPRAEQRGPAPVIAYRVEAWQKGEDGPARWVELGVTPLNGFDAFNLKHGVEYQFRVTPRNRYGWGESVVSEDIVVGRTPEVPEFVRILPGQLKVLKESIVTLECEVKGEPFPDIRWFKDGEELSEDGHFRTQCWNNVCSLMVTCVKEEDDGRYMCEATNSVGRVSTFSRLLVVTDPKVLSADQNLKT